MAKRRTFEVKVKFPSKSPTMPRRPARIYNKSGKVLFRGSNATAERIWSLMLKRSSALDPPTKEEAEVLRKEKRKRHYIY